MRIAFVSCLFTRVLADQPVWDWIAGQAPDHLVLLGDSFYLDLKTLRHPQSMDDEAFARRLFKLYRELMAQAQFAALVRSLPAGHVFSIWDDHDFLWNDAEGAEVHPAHSTKVRLSTAFQEAFREALAQRLAPGSFPARFDDPRFWDPAQPPLTTPSVALAEDVLLHLSDGRTWRTATWQAKRCTLLGAAQRTRLQKVMDAAPDALHLWASGSTVAGYQHYESDQQWLMQRAARQRMLVLSGDIHRNAFDAFHTGGWPLHEATSSAAAIRYPLVVAGEKRQNHGLVEIGAQTVTLRTFQHGQLEDSRVLDRATWLPR